MSFKQVNELRKNGQLREAYDMAIGDIAQTPDDVWATRALFWTLHDMGHAELRQGNPGEALALAERMEQLMPAMGEPEEGADNKHLPERALARLVRHAQPFYADVKMAYREACKGQTIPPYDFVARLIGEGKLTGPLHERAGWIIWHHLWHQHQRMPALEARQALAHYMTLTGVPRPSRLHSRILSAALMVSRRFGKEFDLVRFVNLWDVRNFQPEDWERGERKRGPVGTFPSLVEQAIGQYIGFKKSQRDISYTPDFLALLETAAERYPDRPELTRYLSLSLLNRGEKERALELHRKLAQRLDRYYVWHELASMLTHNLDMKTSALCRSLAMPVPENYTCDIHRELGWELAREGDMAAALLELETYSAIRERCGRPRSWRYEQLRKRIPADTVMAESNVKLYADRSQLIVDWVYQDLPQWPAIVLVRFTDKQGKENVKLALPGGKMLFAKAAKLGIESRFLHVRVLENGGKLRLLSAIEAERDDVLSAFDDVVTGTVRIFQGQGSKQYGFVEGCFVPGQLLDGLTHGDTITVVTEMQPDGRRRAIAVV